MGPPLLSDTRYGVCNTLELISSYVPIFPLEYSGLKLSLSAFSSIRDTSSIMASNASIKFENTAPCTDILQITYPSLVFLDSGFASLFRLGLSEFGSTSVFCVENARQVLVFTLLLSVPFVVTYLAMWLHFQASWWSKKIGKVPSTIPYLVPFLGSTIPYFRDPFEFVKSST